MHGTFVAPPWERRLMNSLDDRFERDDVRVNFGAAKMPDGYTVWWLSSMEMFYWHRERDGHLDGPYSCRWNARRNAIADSKSL